jgi:hypothetical protein
MVWKQFAPFLLKINNLMNLILQEKAGNPNVSRNTTLTVIMP